MLLDVGAAAIVTVLGKMDSRQAALDGEVRKASSGRLLGDSSFGNEKRVLYIGEFEVKLFQFLACRLFASS